MKKLVLIGIAAAIAVMISLAWPVLKSFDPTDYALGVVSGGPWVVFILMTLESASLPIPSEVLLPLTGYMISQGRMELVPALTAAIAGSMLGSYVDYAIGKVVGLELLGRTRWVSRSALESATRWFDRYGAYAVFLTRFLAGFRTLISFPAGAFGMRLTAFSLCTLAGSAIWDASLIYLGIFLGSRWSQVVYAGSRYYLEASALVVVLLLAGLALFLLRRKGRI
ncbi:MAG: DedA family protein [Thermoprotei archaeon]|nr:DedA family protein [TACK group archaeon]